MCVWNKFSLFSETEKTFVLALSKNSFYLIYLSFSALGEEIAS